MAKSTTSEFIHKPNDLISFLTTQCLVDGEPLKVPAREQDFLNKVYEFNTGPLRRICPRRQGNTTLLAAIGLFYALNGVSSVIGTISYDAQRQTLDMLRESLHVIPYEIQTTNTSIRLGVGNKLSESVIVKSHNELQRMGYSHKPGIILLDDIRVDDFALVDKIIAMHYTIPVIVNVTP